MSWGMVIAAGAALVGGTMSAKSQKKAGQAAADAQSDSAQMGIEEQRRQFDIATTEQRNRFDQIQKILAPFVNAGTGAIAGQQDLLGLNGQPAQANAFSAIESSPMFTGLAKQGENAILANASATGGLRGGNVQAALSQFRPQLLAQMISDQFSRLGGVSSLGQNAAAGVGNASFNTGAGIAQGALTTGSNISGLLQQQGAAQAGNFLNAGRADAEMWNSFAKSAGTMFGGKGGKF